MSHRVSDLFNYVDVVAPVDGNYELLNGSGFPPRPLTDRNATIEEAGLDRA